MSKPLIWPGFDGQKEVDLVVALIKELRQRAKPLLDENTLFRVATELGWDSKSSGLTPSSFILNKFKAYLD